jgi:CubicO group peptidase (beta-lactamase class C family)
MKRILPYVLYLIVGLILGAIVYLGITFPPILAGTAAKTMCSCVYVLGRTPESVRAKELTVVPGLSSSTVTFRDSSSVTAKFLWKSRTAIYRKGLGCTLLAERSEEKVRNQTPAMPGPLPFSADSVAWPLGDKNADTVMADVNYSAMAAALDTAFAETNPEKPKNTLAVLVVYNGQIVAERYAPGVTQYSKLMGWSMTKSLTNALIGRLVLAGKLKTEEPAPVPEWQSDDRKNITLNNLMQASSGLEWNESYFTPGLFHNMFMNSDDKGAYAASQELKYPIGTQFEYSSGTTNILSRIVRQTMGDENYPAQAYESFFHKIGMHHTLIELDASGTFVGSSYGYASARDWARFGLLYLNDGMLNGERILPEGWVAYSSTPAPAAPRGEYGAQFWLNAGEKGNPDNCYHPGVPNDEFGCEGFEEQNVFIIPSKKLVLVRLGISHHGFDIEGLTRQVIAALP